MESIDLKQLLKDAAGLMDHQINLGPLERGHYIQVGMATGFYIPEADYQTAQARANELHTIQFVGVTKAGAALHGDREEILAHPESAGIVAWITPGVKQ